MSKTLLFSFLLSGISFAGFSQTRFLSPSGTDTGNDCTIPGNPCASITHACSQANDGDTIFVASGNYLFSSAQVLNKSMIVVGDSASHPVIEVDAAEVIQVTAPQVEIHHLRLEMGLSTTSGIRGIVATGNYDSLVVHDCEIISIRPVSFTGMVFSAYGIQASGGNGQTIFVHQTTISPADTLNDAFGRGIGIGLNGSNGPGAEISDCTIRAFYPIQSISTNGDLEIHHNTFIGNVLITYMGNSTSAHLHHNSFDGYNDVIASNLISLLEIRAANNVTVMVDSNSFSNYLNVAMFSSASRNVSVRGNTFTPKSNADEFVSLLANTKLFTAGTQNTGYQNNISIAGNIFNSGISGSGAGILLGDHYGLTSPAFSDSITIGGPDPADFNQFDSGLAFYIGLDTLSGPTNQVAFWAGYSVTNMQPFSQSVFAYQSWNNFNLTDSTEIENRMLDSLDFIGTGKVIWQEPVITSLNEESYSEMFLAPNPSEAEIFVYQPQGNSAKNYAIIDLNGRVLQTGWIKQERTRIDISGLAPGVYLIYSGNNQMGSIRPIRFIKL